MDLMQKLTHDDSYLIRLWNSLHFVSFQVNLKMTNSKYVLAYLSKYLTNVMHKICFK